ncbi:hypothetical protein F2P81_010672 [Scophthalmus maximus]|uniref:Protein N-terminal asparagine amidohydrolase n=1 Tax=Scophthalmus maximus TaxID=52904 RepID=A0A6A4T0G6_SCOMX|nr:hypothetical protein F2P81_010672 [Scophthalmus maximus]
MPLFSQNRRLERINATAELFDKYPHLQENARTFRAKPLVDVDPKCFLYVQQREFAATTPADGSGAVCLAHCDGSSTWSEVPLLVQAVTSLSSVSNDGRLELHLVGGFNDESKTSHKLSHNILEMNDIVVDGTHRPVVYGIGVNVKTGDVFPSSFIHKGPAEQLRSARTFTGGQYLSTSPMAEPPHFVQHMKSTIQFLLEHPDSDELFPGAQPQLYHRTEMGDWERVVKS